MVIVTLHVTYFEFYVAQSILSKMELGVVSFEAWLCNSTKRSVFPCSVRGV